MKTEFKEELSYTDCTRIIQGINTLENIWEDSNTLDAYDKFTLKWIRQTFTICRESIKKHRKVELRIISK